MSRAEEKISQYLSEAHASELALTRVLQSQILMAPRGSYRSALQSHLKETREHAERVRGRLDELGGGSGPLAMIVGFAESAVGQMLALAKTPLDLLRGSSGEEKVLKNAKDACATEALEIATYTAIERLAGEVNDQDTARLAASIRQQEERMLERLMDEIPHLTHDVARAELAGEHSYQLTETGAADAAREASAATQRAAQGALTGAKRRARVARKAPGVARAEGQIKGAVASSEDLAISGYDKLTATEIVEKLPELSQIDLAKVESYERRHNKRGTVLSRIATLRSSEPWPGYDELNVTEIRAVLGEHNGDRASAVRAYERAHKNRTSVLEATERERVNAS